MTSHAKPSVIDQLRIKEVEPENKKGRERNVLHYIGPIIAGFYNQDINLARTSSREKKHVLIRQIITYIAKTTYKISTLSIGEYFSGQSRGTVDKAMQAISKYIKDDTMLEAEIIAMRDIIYIKGKLYQNLDTPNMVYNIVDLNNCTALNIGSGRTIILSGLNESEVRAYVDGNNIKSIPVVFKNTGVILLKPSRERIYG